MRWFEPTEYEKWATPLALARPQSYLGLPALDARSRELYERALPRGVLLPRFYPDRPRVNRWMAPHELARHAYLPGQIILGKFANTYLGYLDDRPMVTIAGARAGKTSTVLEPNLCLYPGSLLLLDPKSELARTAILRRALGHDVFVLDPFGRSGVPSACFNPLAELDPESPAIVDDVAAICQAIIGDDGDSRSRHWNDSARALLMGIILLTLTLAESERHLVTVRELLCLAYPPLMRAVQSKMTPPEDGKPDETLYSENKLAIETLLKAMSKDENRYDGVLAAIGNRFSTTPHAERGSIFSTAAAHTDFLDSIPLRKISRRSDFRLGALRGVRPTTICLCLPASRQSHYRWLRLIVQMACTVLEHMGEYPRERPPILFLMEEAATLGRFELLEHAAAYFPSFGIKLWLVLQGIEQLTKNFNKSGTEIILGNAGLIQCFANNDEATLSYISARIEKLAVPFELRMAFSRQRFSQILLMEGEPPAAATRLEHHDVAAIRASLEKEAGLRASRNTGLSRA